MHKPLRLACCALLLVAAVLRAERLPWSVYDSSNGLAGDAVRDLHIDARGFLWIATSSGLSRFDGREFRNYERADGLPAPRVDAIAETRDGSIWVATALGLARLRSDAHRGGSLFVVEPLGETFGTSAVDVLFVDREGSLWIGLADRVARVDLEADGSLRTTSVPLPAGVGDVHTFAESADGTLWIGGGDALARRSREGVIELVRMGDPPGRAPFPGVESVHALAVDRQDRLWVGANGVLFAWLPGAFGEDGDRPILARGRRAGFPGDLPREHGELVVYGAEEGLPNEFFSKLVVGREELWAATRKGIFSVSARGVRAITAKQGLVEPLVSAAVEDADGALWLGTESRGITRLGRSGFIAYDEADGLVGDRVAGILETERRELLVVTWSRELQRFDSRGFEPLTPRDLFARTFPGWGWNQFVLVDRKGRLWFPSADGLFRFSPVADLADWRDAAPERHWRGGTDLPAHDIFRLYEDRRGDVWVSGFASESLIRFEGGELRREVPELYDRWSINGAATAFEEDRGGNLWIGFYFGGLARLANGVWTFFGTGDGLPPGFVGDLHLDRAGRLWVATLAGGVARIDDPAADRPTFVRFSTREGLTTDSTRCLTEDAAGRIFIGTSKGVDRLDPASGGVRSFSTDDGLPNNLVYVCHTATDGALWFGTLHGLARYLPPPEERARAPRVLLSAISVAGEQQPLAEGGAERFPDLVLSPRQRSLRIDFVGVALGLGKEVQFQHRVLGSSDEWSGPSVERSVQLAALAPGAYRFEVRATTRDGGVGANIASVDLRMLPPVWRRAWFVALIAVALAAGAWFTVRIRVGRLLAVERARARIASDLHDDVGSSVSRIGLLGELARRRLRDEPEAAESLLGEIGREASELAEATSDIVWSIDPRRDDLGSLVVRLRRFAVDLLEAKEIELTFESPADAQSLVLDPGVRRALYLTLKEAIHNVAKHSQAKNARVAIALAGTELAAEVVDDGRGIDPARAEQAAAEGRHGLGGMIARAAGAGGTARIEPVAGGGARVQFRFPAGKTARRGSHRDAIRGSRPT